MTLSPELYVLEVFLRVTLIVDIRICNDRLMHSTDTQLKSKVLYICCVLLLLNRLYENLLYDALRK